MGILEFINSGSAAYTLAPEQRTTPYTLAEIADMLVEGWTKDAGEHRKRLEEMVALCNGIYGTRIKM